MSFRYHALALATAVAICAHAPHAFAQCDLTGYKAFTQTLSPPVVVPDGSTAGVTVGPITTTNDGTVFTDVIVALRMTHSYVGDLTIDLTYDRNCDGTPETTSRLVCRPFSEGTCLTGETVTFGCGADIFCTNTYLFSDAAEDEMAGDPTTCDLVTGEVPAGCYRPSVIAAMPLSAMDGLVKGGCFRLHVVDSATPDAGEICEWSVYTDQTGPTATKPWSWHALKVLYR
jgi:hypothetical protein